MKRAVLLCVVLAACAKKGEDKPEPVKDTPKPVAPVDAGVAKPISADAAVVVQKPAAPADAGVAAVSAEDKAATKKYRVALQKGRKLTDEKKYKEAIAAFDEALVAKKGDARALSERGFARLLEGSDLEAATADFNDAASRTKDVKLLSSIWFNRGLVEEKRGVAGNAIVDFYLANQLRPTDAAKAKLAGKKVCPALVENKYEADWPDAKMVDGADWAALAAGMKPISEFETPKTVDEARKLLFENGEVPKLPALVTAGQVGSGRVVYLVVARGQALRAFPVGVDGGGRCPGSVEFEIASQRDKAIHVHGVEVVEGGMTFMCRKAGDDEGDRFECTDKPGEESAGTACLGGSATERDLVVDTESGKVVLVERPVPSDAAADVVVKLTDKGVALTGPGCDQNVAF